MALFPGDFYGAGPSARPTAARSKEVNSSIHRHTSPSYRPNESLTHRHDLQVSMTDLDANEHDLDSSFLANLAGTGELRSSTSTPVSGHRKGRSAIRFSPPSSTQQLSTTIDSPTVLSMLQEQQALLQNLVGEQEEIRRAIKENDKRVALLELTVKSCSSLSHSSPPASSSGENPKKRSITRDLSVSLATNFID